MTARGYCCCYLEHCNETNHIAIKGVIQRANTKTFWTCSLLKTCRLVSCTAQNLMISKFVKMRLSITWNKCLTSKLVSFRWRVQKKKHCDLKIKTSIIVQIIVRDYWANQCSCQVLRKFCIDNSPDKFISLVVQIYWAG